MIYDGRRSGCTPKLLTAVGVDECQGVGWPVGVESHLSPCVLKTYFSRFCFGFLYSVAWVDSLALEH